MAMASSRSSGTRRPYTYGAVIRVLFTCIMIIGMSIAGAALPAGGAEASRTSNADACNADQMRSRTELPAIEVSGISDATSWACATATSLLLSWQMHTATGSSPAAMIAWFMLHASGAQAAPHANADNITRREAQSDYWGKHSCPKNTYHGPEPGTCVSCCHWREGINCANCLCNRMHCECVRGCGGYACRAGGSGGQSVCGVAGNRGCCKVCPSNSLGSPAGSTSFSQCKARPGFWNSGRKVTACPPDATSAPGATHIGNCTCKVGYYDRYTVAHTAKNGPSCSPCKKQESCPRGQYLLGNCSAGGATADDHCAKDCPGGQFIAGQGKCQACSQPTCPKGYFRNTSCAGATDFTCAKLGAACNATKNEWVIRNGTQWLDAAHPGAQWACGSCPSHSALKGKAKSHCSDKQWLSKHGVSCADMRSLKACTADGQFGGGWNPVWGNWKDNADANGVTAKEACCACGGGDWRTAQDVNSCECDSGYYDKDLVSGVQCVAVPDRIKNVAGSKCNVMGMGFGLKTQISIQASTKQAAQLGTMVQFFADIDTGLIAAADFDDTCMQVFEEARKHGANNICGMKVQMFGRASTGVHAILLGVATLQCHGYTGLWTLMKVCTSNCMQDARSSCCFVPNEVAWMFPCCRAMLCCPDQLYAPMHTSAPTVTSAPTATSAPTFAATSGADSKVVCTAANRAVCDKCFAVTHSIAECDGYGLECTCSATCQRHGACAKCLLHGRALSDCESFGLDCACTSAIATSGHRRALGNDGRTPRTLPAVAVAVSIEETSSAESKFSKLMRCLELATDDVSTAKCNRRHAPALG